MTELILQATTKKTDDGNKSSIHQKVMNLPEHSVGRRFKK
jgi:hypothetical protein